MLSISFAPSLSVTSETSSSSALILPRDAFPLDAISISCDIAMMGPQLQQGLLLFWVIADDIMGEGVIAVDDIVV